MVVVVLEAENFVEVHVVVQMVFHLYQAGFWREGLVPLIEIVI